jgi:putative hemolysin
MIFGSAVVSISYLSLVFGEFLPKELALRNPERIACAVAPAMQRISLTTFPIVHALSWSTNWLLLLFRFSPVDAAGGKNQLNGMIEQGSVAAVQTESEHNTANAGTNTAQANESMTPCARMACIDVSETLDDILATVKRYDFSRFPVCDGRVDRVIGVVHVRDLLLAVAGSNRVDVRTIAQEPLFVPATVETWRLIYLFRTCGIEIAFVADENGAIVGLITMADLMRSISGDFAPGEPLTPSYSGN